MDKKVLLIGGNGYVGTAFREFLETRQISFQNLSRKDFDYYKVEALSQVIKDYRPDVLINCAGYTGKPNVDACESHKDECLLGNAVLPGVISRVCEMNQLPWIQISSGCIYTGNTPDGSGFKETDTPNFSFRSGYCSFYSGTKALGEEVLRDDANCYGLRLRIPFNEKDSPRNYISKLLRYDRILNAVNSLSQLDEFVKAAWQLYMNDCPKEIYNLTNPGSVSAKDVIDMIQKAGLSNKEFSFFENESDFMAKAAITPRSNCVLNTDKLVAAGIKLRPVEEALEWSIKNLKSAQRAGV